MTQALKNFKALGQLSLKERVEKFLEFLDASPETKFNFMSTSHCAMAQFAQTLIPENERGAIRGSAGGTFIRLVNKETGAPLDDTIPLEERDITLLPELANISHCETFEQVANTIRIYHK